MLTLIHGEDFVTSRKHFNSLKDKDSVLLDFSNLEGVFLDQYLSGSSLFSQSQKIFIENLFSRKAAKYFTSIVDFLNKAKQLEVYIWADKEIARNQAKELPTYKENNYKIPQNIFSFVDRIYPRSVSNLKNFHTVLSQSEPEFVFSMIVRQFRLMLGLMEKSANNIEEVKRLQDWQVDKLQRQATSFGLENLKKIYKKLYKIEKSQKTGASKLNLVQSIDILLLEI